MKTLSIIVARPRLFYFMIQDILTYKNELIGFIMTSNIIKKQTVPSTLKSLYSKVCSFLGKIWDTLIPSNSIKKLLDFSQALY